MIHSAFTPFAFPRRSSTNPSGGLCLVVAMIAWWSVGSLALPVWGQASRRLPSDEYYMSLGWLHEGRLAEAEHGFETAYSKSRHVGEQFGIDAVPSLIRIGQTLCWQGDLENGLDQIEAGLSLAHQARRWIRFIRPQPTPLRGMSNDVRGIQWHPNQRRTQLAAFPDDWSVAIGAPRWIREVQQGEADEGGEALRMDPLEIYYAQAVGLLLRYRLLGELARELPISQRFVESYSLADAGKLPAEVLSRAHTICHALALISTGESQTAKSMLEKSLTIDGEWDHPLTGVALLGLAELALERDERSAALEHLADATLLFARLGQFDMLAEATEQMANIAAAQRGQGSLAMLGEIAQWVKSRSHLAFVAATAHAAGLGIELEKFAPIENDLVIVLRPVGKGIAPIPLLQATARYAQAQSLIKRDRVDEGLTLLNTALKSLQGDDSNSPLARPLFCLRWIERLLDLEIIEGQKAEGLMRRYLEGPSPADWTFRPLESLATVTANREPIDQRWFELVLRRGEPAATIDAVEAIHRRRCWSELPLGGRSLQLRLLFHRVWKGDDAEQERWKTSLRKLYPAIDQSADLLGRQADRARSIQAIDSKQWSVEERQIWNQYVEQCDRQEQRLVDAALGRIVIPTVFPPATTTRQWQEAWQGADASNGSRGLLGFFFHGASLYGYAVVVDGVELWKVERPEEVKEACQRLLALIGVGQPPSRVAELVRGTAWARTAASVQELLIPSPHRARLLACEQLTIIPDGWLWYVPFEVLPLPQEPNTPWIRGMSLSYAPWMGTRSSGSEWTAGLSGPPRTLGVFREQFFVADPESDLAIRRDLINGVAGTAAIPFAARVHGGRWSRLQFDQVWVAARTSLRAGAPFSPMGYDNNGAGLRQWLQLPCSSPNLLVYLGNEIPGGVALEGDGSEVFRLAYCLAASGNRAAVLSRWPTGGESSAWLAREFLQSADHVIPSQAWRRSVLSLWETPLSESSEPVVGGVRKEGTDETLSSRHPVFWAGGMLLEEP